MVKVPTRFRSPRYAALLAALLLAAAGCSQAEPDATPATQTPAAQTPAAQTPANQPPGAQATPAPSSAAPSSSATPDAPAPAGEQNTAEAPDVAPSRQPIEIVPPGPRSRLEPAIQAQLEQAERDLEANPNGAEKAGSLAMLYHAYGLLTDAARTYDRAIKLAPDVFRWHYLRGHVALVLGDASTAVEQFRAASKITPEYVPAGIWLGRALVAAGDPEEALRVLQPLHDAHPDDELLGYTLGMTYREVKEPVWALEYLKPVLDKHPEYGAVRAAVAQTFADLGQPEHAESVRTAWPPNGVTPPLRDPEYLAIYKDTVGTEAEMRRAAAYMAAGDAAKAVEHYSAALEYTPKNMAALTGRADARIQTGDLAGGEEDMQAALALDPDDVLALTRLGQLKLLSGDKDGAKQFIKRGRQLAPHDPTLLAMAAHVAALEGDNQAAADALAEATAQAPGNAGLHYEHGVALWRLGEKDGAVKAFQRAEKTDPSYTPALQALADAYLAMGKAGAAETWYLRAYDAGSADPMTCLRTAAVALKASQYDRVEAALLRGLKTDPDNADLNDTLSRLYSLCPYATYRDADKALALAHKAYGEEIAGLSGHALYTLAAAYAEKGDFAQAQRMIEQAIQQAQDAGDTAEATRMQTYLKLYQQNKHVYDVG